MTNFSLSEKSVRHLLEDVRDWGGRGRETGGFLLRGVDSDLADILALAGRTGVRRRRHHFRISALAIGRLFDWAVEHDLSVAAVVHSHRHDAFLSGSDLQGGFSVPGFVTAVIPRYQDPPAEHRRWGWWKYGEGEWRDLTAPPLYRAPVTIIGFDEDGVRES